MATIKSFTDLDQSKKLAEILPLETADMVLWGKDFKYVYADIHAQEFMKGLEDRKMNYFPCWSLAALLELLPKRLEIVDNVYELSVYLYGLYYWNINNGNLCFEAKDKDNFVDACYEAIVFLYEQKLL